MVDDIIISDLKSQVKIAKKIIQQIKEADEAACNDDLNNRFKVINIVGEEGSGKSYICNMIRKEFSKWNFHYIENNSDLELARGGIKIGKRREMFPLPTLSVRLGIFTLGASLRFQEADQLFHDIEKQFIKEINKDYGRSIIFVDNFEKLDVLTQKFVRTICNKDRVDGIYNSFPIVFIITSTAKVFNNINPFVVSGLNKLEIIRLAKAYHRNLNDNEIANIQVLSGGNISFVSNLLKTDKDFALNIQNIIETRLEDIKKYLKYDNYDKIEDICVCGAYFESGFTINQLQKIYADIDDEYFLRLFNALNSFGIVSQKNQFYYYSAEQFKNEMKNRRIDMRQLYFKKMYEFYSTYQSENYNLRLKFAYELLTCGCIDFSECTIALMFSSLLQMIYERKLLSKKDLDIFLSKYSQQVLPLKLKTILVSLISKPELKNLLDISYDEYSILIKSEITILKLKFISSKTSTHATNETIKSAIEIAESLDHYNIELYAELRLRMAIVSLMINRSTLNQLFQKNIEALKMILKKYAQINKELSLAYLMILKRQSSLYNGCDSAMRDLADAIAYNKEQKNAHELYKSYVNFIGLCAVSSMTDLCKIITKKVCTLLRTNKEISFDKYKLKNNLILNNYLRNCFENDKNSNKEIDNKYYNMFKKLYDNSGLKVARLNMVSLLCRINKDDAMTEIKGFLKDNAILFSEDNFYKYYLNDLLLMLLIVNKDWVSAERQYDRLLTIECPPFNDCKVHLGKRLEAYRIIIDNKVVCNDIASYDKIIYNLYMNTSYGLEFYFGSDKSWGFYSRGFLLTDAQFFS